MSIENAVEIQKRDQAQKEIRRTRGIPQTEWDRFYEYLITGWVREDPTQPNWEAKTLARVIQYAFGNSSIRKISHANNHLINGLAECFLISLKHDADEKIDWEKYNDACRRMAVGFVKAIIREIKSTRENAEPDGSMYIGRLKIPNWFVDWAREEAVE